MTSRFGVFLALAIPVAAACTPNVNDSCGDEGKVTCGPDDAVLLCKGGKLAQHGACYAAKHSCGANPVGDNDVWCSGAANIYALAVEGTKCDADGEFSCDADDRQFMLACTNNAWVRRNQCVDGTGPGTCGDTSFAQVGCVVGDSVALP